ncbi:MAG: D-tyrosyl-tRNA(Tyr) deacylase, partial [Thermoleophilia bacterium]|nr:D-tyrosyl-tRNA(Tyr) deacylase [Thermoleophilia bacterium]
SWMAKKIADLRLFADDEGKFNRSIIDIGGSALVVSQFTLYADAAKGTRPSFAGAASPEIAKPRYEQLCEALSARGIVAGRGIFGAAMQVSLVNDGPVTMLLEREARS